MTRHHIAKAYINGIDIDIEQLPSPKLDIQQANIVDSYKMNDLSTALT